MKRQKKWEKKSSQQKIKWKRWQRKETRDITDENVEYAIYHTWYENGVHHKVYHGQAASD
jgi:hypothetical protein